MLLLLDNRDSFTFNLVQALQALGEEVRVVHRERADVPALLAEAPSRIVIGPGPGTPGAADAACELLLGEHSIPVLGVCLGHQCLAHVLGARMGAAPALAHGSVVSVEHDGRGLFEGIPSPTPFMRYNSLSVQADSLPDELQVSARGEHGEVMGLRHRERPLTGVQFHPESFLSPFGRRLLGNFLRS